MLKFGILMEIGAKYTPQQIESKWYDYWIRHNFFHSTPDGREPYTIVIPPPNVTGVLPAIKKRPLTAVSATAITRL